MQKVKKEQLAKTLDHAIQVKMGKKGINTLIFGWMEYRKFGQQYRHAIYSRDWLFVTEVIDLSDYAGYDLMTGERLPDK